MSEVIKNFTNLGITVKNNGKVQKVRCPNCAQIGKKNLKDTSLLINLETGVYKCFKCDWKGKVETEYKIKQEVIQTYKIPQKPNISKLTDIALQYFVSRGIPQEILIKNHIASSQDGKRIVFPYMRNNTLVNFKSRELTEKKFYQAAEAEPIMFNLDRITGQNEIIICEGEIDAMSFEVAGYTNHTSVNQGAPNPNDTQTDKKLACITNCYEAFDSANVIYLAVDNDVNGLILQKELIRRLGAERCKIVDFQDCKDANEFLVKYGAFELSTAIKMAKDVRIEGIFTLQDNFDSMMHGFENGQNRGETTYIDEVDKAWKWRKGEVNVWTGYENEGKSLFLNQLSVIRAYFSGEKFAVFSPENMPMDDYYNDLIEMFIGKTTDPYYGDMRMSKEEYLEAMQFVNKHFFLIYPDADFKLDTIFEKAKFLVRKEGIDHLIIDPYNTVEHLMIGGEREELYISRFMARLKRFAIDNDISVHLVAHQNTPRQNKEDGGRSYRPMLSNIKGGGVFAQKADNVCYIWRPNRLIDFRDNEVIFGSQKIKKQKLVARPRDIDNIRFEFTENRYYFDDECAFEKIDRSRNVPLKPKGVSDEQLTVFDGNPQFESSDSEDQPF